MNKKQKCKLGEKIQISILKEEPNFDRATEQAYCRALTMFNSDGYGNLLEVKGFDRSNCSIKMKFDNLTYEGSMSGHEITYKFSAWTEKYCE